MATGTLIYLPINDISVNHTKSSSSGAAYTLIKGNDDDSTYIYSASGTNSGNAVSKTSSFSFGIDNFSFSNLTVLGIKLHCIVRKTADANASFSCVVGIGTTQGASDTGVSSTNLITNYQDYWNSLTTLKSSLNNYIQNNLSFPNLRIDLTTTSTRTAQKANNEVRVTQIFLEIEYETIETSKIYLKENNTWKEYSKVYIKENNSWVEKSMSEISSIFSTTANYVKGS